MTPLRLPVCAALLDGIFDKVWYRRMTMDVAAGSITSVQKAGRMPPPPLPFSAFQRNTSRFVREPLQLSPFKPRRCAGHWRFHVQFHMSQRVPERHELPQLDICS